MLFGYTFRMKEDYIKLIEATPKFKTKKCKVFALLIQLFLEYTTFVVAALAWLLYDYFIAGAALLLAFIVMGIIRSKMRNSSIPFSQQEFHYNDKGIALWFCARHLCFETQESEC